MSEAVDVRFIDRLNVRLHLGEARGFNDDRLYFGYLLGGGNRQGVPHRWKQEQRPEVQSEHAKLCCAHHDRVVSG